MAARRTPGVIVQTVCPACRLQQHHIRRGASVAGDQRRLAC